MIVRANGDEGMNRISSAEYLEALQEAEADDGVGPGVNDVGPGLDASEAERMAWAAEEPVKRNDGKPVGLEGWKRTRQLTESQKAFAQGVIEGKSYRQAYRDAYPNAKAADQTIASSAFKLSRDPRILALIQAGEAEQQEFLAEDMAGTRRYVMRQLLGLSKAAKQEGSQLKALELLGRAAGMWRDVQPQQQQAVTAAELKAALAGHLRHLALVKPAKRDDAGDGAERVDGGGVKAGSV